MRLPATGMRRLKLWLAAIALGWLTACSQPPHAPNQALPTANTWSGRLALQVEGAASQSFSAGFELSGTPDQGELILLNPLGNVSARLRWSPGLATLHNGKEQRQSSSLDALVTELLGSPLPVAALFSWLHGGNVLATGWQANLGALEQGRLIAQRYAPPPLATLRIALNR